MGKKLNSRQRCASDVAGDVAGDKSLATGVHFRFGPCTTEHFGSLATFRSMGQSMGKTEQSPAMRQ